MRNYQKYTKWKDICQSHAFRQFLTSCQYYSSLIYKDVINSRGGGVDQTWALVTQIRLQFQSELAFLVEFYVLFTNNLLEKISFSAKSFSVINYIFKVWKVSFYQLILQNEENFTRLGWGSGPQSCVFFPTATLGREADAAGIAALFFFCCFFHPGLKSIAAKKPLRNSR